MEEKKILKFCEKCNNKLYIKMRFYKDLPKEKCMEEILAFTEIKQVKCIQCGKLNEYITYKKDLL